MKLIYHNNFIITLLSSIFFLISRANASRISYELVGYENACFYNTALERHLKASFYFSIYRGDDFEVDYSVKGPGDRQLIFGANVRQGDYVFTANDIGEYSFCFSNPTGNIKIIDFEIIFNSSDEYTSPLKLKDPEHLNTMEKSLVSIQKISSSIMRDQRIFRSREGRNEAVITDLSGRVHYYSVSVVIIVGVMAIIQVLAIRSFFATKSRH
ncbi:putative endosomal cargo receptor [Neoconidiobolus thromboides FSU 785]|nr:putative endosomal cargo receptor [Neoconidiobolus thromboides FSU 785]